MYFVSGSCFILTCYETVHRTVSAKFINEFGASCLLCFAQFTPPSKRQKAPKTAWTRCPSCFFIIPPSATSCTHRLTCRFGRCFCTLCRGLHRRPAPFAREAKRLIHFYSVRFSHFIDSLKLSFKLKESFNYMESYN